MLTNLVQSCALCKGLVMNVSAGGECSLIADRNVCVAMCAFGVTIIHSAFASYLDVTRDCCSETELFLWLGYPSSSFCDSLSVRWQLSHISVTWAGNTA